MSTNKIRTRFPPSPTGSLHIGGARTALFNWLFARHHGGEFVLRIEDSDTQRSTDEATKVILEGLAWLGLNYDEGPFYQSERTQRYKEVISELLASGNAYYCYTTPEELEVMREEQKKRGEKMRYDGRWRDSDMPHPEDIKPVVRFKTPKEGFITYEDGVYGTIRTENNELDDLVIARSDGSPTYNLCVVVDDIDMQITHIIRGDDHINNTPRQLHIYKALDAMHPTMIHVPMVLGEDGSRLSKRHGATSVTEYCDQGYLPQALLNYLVRLGWSHGDQEIFSLEEMIATFSIEGLNKASGQFDLGKLQWLNQHYIQSADPASLLPALSHLMRHPIDESMLPMIALQQPRHNTLLSMANDCNYFIHAPTIDSQAWQSHCQEEIAIVLKDLLVELEKISNWKHNVIFESIKTTAKNHGMKVGSIGMPLRFALTGMTNTPSIGEIAEILGQEETIKRLKCVLPYS